MRRPSIRTIAIAEHSSKLAASASPDLRRASAARRARFSGRPHARASIPKKRSATGASAQATSIGCGNAAPSPASDDALSGSLVVLFLLANIRVETQAISARPSHQGDIYALAEELTYREAPASRLISSTLDS